MTTFVWFAFAWFVVQIGLSLLSLRRVDDYIPLRSLVLVMETSAACWAWSVLP